MGNSSALEKNNLYNISVIIPVYNMEKYLKKTLDNYILQNNNKIEFIIIDDGSTDLSGSICDTYMNSHKNVRVYHTKNHGVASSRNYGIALSEGEYLAFLDADDFIDKNMLSSMYCFAKEYSLDFVHCGISMERETSDGKYIVQSLLAYDSKNNVYSYHDIVSNMLSLWEKAVPYNVVNKLYKRSIIKDNDINFPDLKMGEDLEFNLRYMKHIKCMGTIPECLYHYVRDRENSATSNYVVNWFPIRVAEHQ
ncbi:MAG TPA: glycosyltransferase family 2 protein, partial [Ruminiclostridium sp.]|nr:glycosyltransferase family 2 protein [Ruminiclostridium sp.]